MKEESFEAEYAKDRPVLKETFTHLQEVKKHVGQVSKILRTGNKRERLIAAQCLRDMAAVAARPLSMLWNCDIETLQELAKKNQSLPLMVAPKDPPGYDRRKERVPFRVKRLLTLPIGEASPWDPHTHLGLHIYSAMTEINMLRDFPRAAETELEKSAAALLELGPDKESKIAWKKVLTKWIIYRHPESFKPNGHLWEMVQNSARTIWKRDQGLKGKVTVTLEDPKLISRALAELIRKWLQSKVR